MSSCELSTVIIGPVRAILGSIFQSAGTTSHTLDHSSGGVECLILFEGQAFCGIVIAREPLSGRRPMAVA
jgi:hypothetical protein